MGIDRTFGLAFAKSQIAAGDRLPTGGMVFMSLADRDKPAAVTAARRFVELGLPDRGHARHRRVLEDHGVPVAIVVAKLNDAGEREPDGVDGPDAVELISGGHIDHGGQQPRGSGARADGRYIRAAANFHRVPLPDHGRRRPGRGRGHGRLGPSRASGPLAPGVAPRVHGSAGAAAVRRRPAPVRLAVASAPSS